MLSVPQMEAAVKAAPMPIQLKEQILDAVLGQHDALHRQDRKRKTTRPMCDRVAEARKIGGFKHLRTLPGGDAVYAYCKKGVPFYEVVERDGVAASCGCKDYDMESTLDPEYRCKHMILFDEAGQTLEEMIADLKAKAAHAEGVAIERRLGLPGATAEAEAGALRELRAARLRLEELIPEDGWTVSLTAAGAALAA